MDIVGPRTMEFCRRWGIADWVRDAPYPGDYPQDCIYVTGAQRLRAWARAVSRRARRKNARRKARRSASACRRTCSTRSCSASCAPFRMWTLRYGTELVSFEETADGVLATVRDNRHGRDRTNRGRLSRRHRWRRELWCASALGITMSGNPALTYTTNVMFRCADFPVAARQGAGLPLHLHRAGGHLAHHRGDQRRRPLPHVDRRLGRQGAALRRTTSARRYGAPPAATSTTRFSRSCTGCGASWSPTATARERVFIAGDAAHLMSPTGGFGMNTGIQDAVDLGWKLEADMRGWGGAELLRSYEIERRPVAVRNVNEASSQSRPHAVDPPAPAAARNFRSPAARATRRARSTAPGSPPPCGTNGSRSAFISATATRARRSSGRTARRRRRTETATYTQTARPGHRAPHVWLAGWPLDPRPVRPRLHAACVSAREAPVGERVGTAAADAGVPLERGRSRRAGGLRALSVPPRPGPARRPRRLARGRRAGRRPGAD